MQKNKIPKKIEEIHKNFCERGRNRPRLRGFRFAQNKTIVSPGRLERPTIPLRGGCSTIELRTQKN